MSVGRHYWLTNEQRDVLRERLMDIVSDPDVDEADPDEIAVLRDIIKALDTTWETIA